MSLNIVVNFEEKYSYSEKKKVCDAQNPEIITSKFYELCRVDNVLSVSKD